MFQKNKPFRVIPKIYGLFLLFNTASHAALTDIYTGALTSFASANVKPNVLFTLDNSGSMASEYMPDGISTQHAGYYNPSCSYIYYNTNKTYSIPTTSTGIRLNNSTPSTFNSAWDNGYHFYTGTGTSQIDLRNNFFSQNGFYVVYKGSQTLTPLTGHCISSPNKDLGGNTRYISSTTALGICENAAGTSTRITTTGACDTSYPNLIWEKKYVTSTSGPSASDERLNFANWFSYYRNRMNMMKSSAGAAFLGIDDSYRVGFITIDPGSPVNASQFLSVSDFNSVQRNNWYNKFYTILPSNMTPLREAVSRAGRYFAHITTGINNGMPTDPVQYSCQQNFLLLTTDGYWNSNAGQTLSGGAITNYDGNETSLDAYNAVGSQLEISPRPVYDGTTAYYSWNTAKIEYKYEQTGCSGTDTKIRSRQILTRRDYTASNQGGTAIGLPVDTVSDWSDRTTCSASPGALPGTPSGTTNFETLTGYIASRTAPLAPYPALVAGCTGWPCQYRATATGTSNSLADTAQYYYMTDLRNSSLSNCTGVLGVNVCTDNVPHDSSKNGPEDNTGNWQHMVTFTMGLGIPGTLNSTGYKSGGSQDFNKIRMGALNWPSLGASATYIDDLWHAAVNGRGEYFAATDPTSVATGIADALIAIKSTTGAASGGAAQSQNSLTTTNFFYRPTFLSVAWTGELVAQSILATGGLGSDAWSAQGQLDLLVKSACDNRTIKLFRASTPATYNLVDFSLNSYACDASGNPTGSPSTGLNASEQANFGATQVSNLSQYAQMTDGTSGTVDQRSISSGSNMVNFLRGQKGLEGFTPNSATHLYRSRDHALADIMYSQPVVVEGAAADFTDPAYSTFKTTASSRQSVIYVGANDGMLHAFASDATGGRELWAFIPSEMLSNLYKLANTNYGNNHQPFVDGQNTVMDVFDSSVAGCSTTPTSACWKTILVGGFRYGGKGYFALDITNPAAPKGLWEFKWSSTCYPAATSSDCNVGYSFGNPVIGKLANGTWVTIVTSGYNNVSGSAGDGRGYLYVLNVLTGQIISKIDTGVGNATTPSGLGFISGWINDALHDRSIDRIYGTDLLGNVWRFDINGTIPPVGIEATLFATVTDSGGVGLPIMTRPRLAEIGGDPYVFIGTGRFLGTSDYSYMRVNSLWAIKDSGATSGGTVGIGTTLRSSLRQNEFALVIDNTNAATAANRALDHRTVACINNCASTNGWFIDLAVPSATASLQSYYAGERVNIELLFSGDTLVALSNIPSSTECSNGGDFWINILNLSDGLQPTGTTVPYPSVKLASLLGTSLNYGLAAGALIYGSKLIITTASGSSYSVSPGIGLGASPLKRVSWREIIQ